MLFLAELVFAWPLTLLLLFFLGAAVLLSKEMEVWATGLVLVAVGVFVLAAMKTDVTIDWSKLGLWSAYYVAAGLLFLWPKWIFYSHAKGRKFAEYKKRFVSGEHKKNWVNSRIKEQLAYSDKLAYDREPSNEQWNNVRAEAEGRYAREFKNRFEEEWNTYHSSGVMKITRTGTGEDYTIESHYDKIAMTGAVTAWAAYWPVYGVLLVLEDFVKTFWEWFLTHMGGWFRRYATKALNTA